MNLQGVINRVDLGVQRDDLKGYLRDFVNEARKELQKLRDWTFCHEVLPLVMPSGANQVELFPNFKSLGDSPSVFLLDPSGCRLGRCEVKHRASLLAEYRRGWFSGCPTQSGTFDRRTAYRLWWDIIGGTPFLGLPTGIQASEDITLEVSYYRYLPALIEGTDVDEFTLNHENMLISLAKAIAFSAINDPQKTDATNDAMTAFKISAAKDDHIRLAGVSLRMGG